MNTEKCNPVLEARRLVLGISGGVAAYKAVYLARRLIEVGAEVRTVMTTAALRFVGERSLSAVTGHRAVTSLFGDTGVSPHTELARWAEAIVVAPATSNVLAKVANGLSDDALTATVAAFDGPVVMAPAMHTEMWQQPACRRNVERLSRDGRRLVGPESGALAGGDSGMGRMAEPEDIVAATASVFDSSMSGVTVLVTAGGTREAIDPVRYVGNRSSGKMGHAVAVEAVRRGARVILVTTVAGVSMPDTVETVRVESAADMAAEVWSRSSEIDVAVLAAAVADFRPSAAAPTKLARADGPPRIVLEPAPNVLSGLVQRVASGVTIVGFAAETGGLDRAVGKAASYGVDFIVANDVTMPGSGFGTDTNQVSIISPDGTQERLALMTKLEVARVIMSRIVELRTHGG
ncbi:MAG: bifunctional phosphopantothenoylcysteine decarboxylase/phosphopantothenate--cysteine ligase CoaBC [bacterium]|nr:bifunctional phosphopantothenoylcysteine decarboxylase/phosphopantothenate--cysteine ligase CoaBC [bacterium]